MSDESRPLPFPVSTAMKAWRFISSPEVEGAGVIHNVPGDPGGTTRWGFAQKFNPDIDVTTLNFDTAFARFLEKFWKPLQCEMLPPQVAVALADYAFNAGADDAIPDLQRAVFARIDGFMGQRTIDATHMRFDRKPGELLDDYFSFRAMKYLSSPRIKSNRGWLVRSFRLRAYLEREIWK